MNLARQLAVPPAMAALIVVQIVCSAFFVGDVVADYREDGWTASSSPHLLIETLATLSLCAAILFEISYLREMGRRKARLEQSLSLASAAVHEVIDDQFDGWGLTPSERDVAGFLVKGMSIPEIAQLRGGAEGTVKSHLNSIYRKSGTKGRGDLLSAIIETLMQDQGDTPVDRTKLMADAS